MDSHKRNIKQFAGERYSVWKFRVRGLLSEAGVLKTVDKPPPREYDRKWINNAEKAKNIIIDYLSDSMLSSVSEKNTAREIFQRLDDLYERKSLAVQLSIRKQLLNLKLDSEMSLVNHFNLFDDLINDLSSSGAKLDEMDKVSHLLMTLPASYAAVITAIETLAENTLSLAFVKTRLLDQEVKINNQAKDTSQKVLQVVEVKKTYNNGNNFFKRNFKGNKNNRKLVKCHFCNKIGHIKKNCFLLKNNNFKTKNYNNKHKTVQAVQPESNSFIFMCDRATTSRNNDNAITFILDSGASDHLVNDATLFESGESVIPPLQLAVAKSNIFIEATMKGNIKLMNDNKETIVLKNALFCADVPNNIISVKRMQDAGLSVTFNPNGVVVTKDNNLVFKSKNSGNISKVNFYKICEVNSIRSNEYSLWHGRLGHVGVDNFNKIKNEKLFADVGLLDNVKPSNELCEACVKGKQARLKYQHSKNKTNITRPLYVVHTDVCGPISPETFDEKKYFVVYVDDYTHYCVTYIVKRKSDVFETFQDFVAKATAHFSLKVVHLYADNGTEYLSNNMKEFCVKNGISYHLTVPYSPQLNGVAERMIRTLTEKTRSIIHASNLKQHFWGEVIQAACYLTNICPSRAVRVSSKTPFEMWHGKKPILKYLRLIGATIYVHYKLRETKFQEKAWKGILVGYSANGYRVWNENLSKIIIARDVTVDEMSITNLNSRPSPQSENVKIEHFSIASGRMTQENPSHDEQDITSERMTQENPSQVEQDITSESMTMNESIQERNTQKIKPERMAHKKRILDSNSLIENVPESMAQGPSVIINSENSFETEYNSEESMQPQGKLRRSERIKSLPKLSYDEENDMIMCAQSFVSNIPKDFNDIIGRSDQKEWENAIKEEVKSLNENNTWVFVSKPEGKNIVGCKWVFAVKHNEKGDILRYKARLVAKGFSQEYLSDYDETFAPVARISSFRFLIAFSNQNDLLIHHMDVKTAFLNGNLTEEIFMKVPEGIQCEPNKVCKLNKALYGLKQAARCWFTVFEKTLIEKGFKNSPVDRCLYFLDKGDIKKNIYVILYVDDIIISTAFIETMNSFKNYLSSKFKMTDLKDVKLFLGIRIQREHGKIYLDQTVYINNILKKFNMEDCKAIDTPLPTKIDLEKLNTDENTNLPCRNLIGSLMYLMLCTRPDLSYSINILSRYSNKNNRDLFQYLKRILRYIKGTATLKLTYEKCNYEYKLCGYVDSDWGGDPIDKKSTTGFVFKLFGKNSICWNTRKQSSVAASSTEAEYMALFEAVREALWIKSLSESIGFELNEPIIIYEDNQGCISIAKNPTCHKRSKHISIKYHFTREQVEKNVITLIYLPTEHQLADVMTKSLPAVKFAKFMNDLGLTN